MLLRILTIVLLLLGHTSAVSVEKVAPNKQVFDSKRDLRNPERHQQPIHEAGAMDDKSFNSVVWALNVGGHAYLGADGIEYQADNSVGHTLLGFAIKGSQDDSVLKTYRAGPLEIGKSIENGRYDLMFKFMEPEDSKPGGRVFNVLVEGQRVIANLDILLARDGNPRSSLTRMIPNVDVNDGRLDILLEPVVGEPILSAIIVQTKTKRGEVWRQVWGDEFDYTGPPDPKKWSFNVWPAGKVNGEEQAYTARQKNVRVEQGRLVIEAHKEEYAKASYTSGRIHSARKGDLLYGRIEVRAKLPAGQGTWPALWMLPTAPFTYATTCTEGADWQGSSVCDAWPNSGEIDIMEHVGYDMNRVHGTVHTKSYYWVNGEQRKASVEAEMVDQRFHVYAMEWSPDRIDVFYDDAIYFTYLNDGGDWRSWPFDHPFHLVMNVAVGGGWGGAGGPTDASAFPTAMLVDYVRLYQKTENKAAN